MILRKQNCIEGGRFLYFHFSGVKMFDSECIFCKIIQKQIPSKIIKENDDVLVIEDISPKAPVHYLVIPKKHIVNIKSMVEQDLDFAKPMLKMVNELAQEVDSFNLVANNGKGAGQSVFHMHWHFISGKNLKKVVGSL